MASAVDRLLDELLSSDDEQDVNEAQADCSQPGPGSEAIGELPGEAAAAEPAAPARAAGAVVSTSDLQATDRSAVAAPEFTVGSHDATESSRPLQDSPSAAEPEWDGAAGLTVGTAEPTLQPGQPRASMQAAGLQYVPEAAGSFAPASLELKSELRDGGAVLVSAPAAPAQASLLTAAATAECEDLFGDLVLSAQSPLPSAQSAASGAAAESNAGASSMPLLALDDGLAEVACSGQQPAQPAVALAEAAAEMPESTSQSARLSKDGGSEASLGGELSGGLSDIESGSSEEEGAEAPFLPAGVPPALTVRSGQPLAAATLPQPATAGAAEHAAVNAAEVAPDDGSDGLSDVSTETDAGSESEALAPDVQQTRQASLSPPLAPHHEEQPPAGAPMGLLRKGDEGAVRSASGDSYAQGQQLPALPQAAQASESFIKGQPSLPEPEQQSQQQRRPEELLLQAAERLEARLAAGGLGGSGDEEDNAACRDDLLLASIVSQLEPEVAAAAEAAKSAGGRNGSAVEGAVLGRSAAARAFLSPSFEQLFRGPQPAGPPCAVAKYLGIAAVGTSSGTTFVLLPGTAPAPGSKQPQQPPRLLEVAEKHQQSQLQRDSVTALCMGQHGGGVLLIVGHASGAARVWELKTQLGGGVHFALVKSLGGMHATAVTATALLDGAGSATWALTADAHGRLMAHNLSRHLSVAASAISSFARGLTGSGGAGPSHLIPLQQSSPAKSFDPGMVCALLPLHGASSATGGKPTSSTPQQHFSAEAASTLFIPEVGHFLMVVCTRAVLACSLTPEGRLQMLHVFLPPNNTPAHCNPYATWRLSGSTRSLHGSPAMAAGQPAVSVTLAVAWHHNMSVYSVELLQRQPQRPAALQSAGTPQPPAQPLPPPVFLRSWSQAKGSNVLAVLDEDSNTSLDSAAGGGPDFSGVASDAPGICGCYFLDSGPLVVLSSQGETATMVHLYRSSWCLSTGSQQGSIGSSDVIEEALTLTDWIVSGQALAAGSNINSFHQSVNGFGDQLLLLTSRGIRVVQLLSWQQRLSALASQPQQLAAALLAAVNIYRASTNIQGQQQKDAQAAWPADGFGAATPEVRRQLLTILCAYVEQGLAQHHHQQDEEGASTSATVLHRLAGTAISCCLLVHQPEALWSDIFPRFNTAGQPQQHSFAASTVSPAAAFLQQLLLFILSDHVPSVAPEVMQLLVEQCVAAGQTERLEACVLKMNLLSLDLNQLIPLCIQHHLFAALIHIFTHALQDCQTPAALLLIAAAAATEADVAPVGALARASLASVTTDIDAEVLLQQNEGLRLGYKLFAFLRCCMMGHSYPPGTGQAPFEQQQRSKAQVLAFLVRSTSQSVWDCWRLWGEMAHTRDVAILDHMPPTIQDPCPALRYLCQLDAPGVLGLLQQGLVGWDALESDLADMSSGIRNQSAPIGTVRTVAQAVVDAVVALLDSGAFATQVAPMGTGTEVLAATTVGSSAQQMSSVAESAAVQFLAKYLASNRASVSSGMLLRVLRHLASAPQAGPLGTGLSTTEREAVFGDVISAAGSTMSPADWHQAVFLARQAGFKQAEAQVRHAQGACLDALACLANDPRYPGAVFMYVRDVLAEPSFNQSQRDAFIAATLLQAPQLLKLDAKATSQLMLDCFPEQQNVLLGQLDQHPDLQFALLNSMLLIYQQQQQVTEGTRITNASLKVNTSSSALNVLLADARVANLYVKLLCQYEPQSVLAYLQSHDAYSVDECLEACMQHDIKDGVAFLLERRGDVHSALRIHIQSLDRANKLLVAAVRDGKLDLAGMAASAQATMPRFVGGGAHRPAKLTGPAVLMRGRRPTLRRSSSISPAAEAVTALLNSNLPPPELQAVRTALDNAVAMCLRYAQDHAHDAFSSSRNYQMHEATTGPRMEEHAVADPLQQLWFQVLHCYAALLRDLRQEEQRVEAQQHHATTPINSNFEQLKWHLELMQELFTGFMEDVIGSMAGQIPLKSIADVIMQQYGRDNWGDFKGTLVGLLTACGEELSILQCADRVVAADGTHILARGYRKCMQPIQKAAAYEEA